ncbi:MAG TPA: DUF4123 domain-containing protein [Burkholderiaceae bacterium]|nr:DUF4123 domain-containing protein [Burkholderiaceae bacterium]
MTLQPTTPDALLARVQRSPQLLLILDAGLEPELEAIVRKLDHRIWHAWVYSHTEYASQHRDGPLLIQARSDSPLLQAFMQPWVRLHWGGLLLSAQSFNTVLEHLRSQRHALLPDGTQPLLRLHEPRALRGMVRDMDSLELDTLLGPVDHWYWCEWNEGQGDWYGVGHSMPGRGQAANGPLRLSATHLHSLQAQQTQYRNMQFVRRLLASGIAALDGIDEATMLTYVQKHTEDAFSRGFENNEDMLGFLDVYFRYHDQLFEKQSALASIMGDLKTPAWRRLLRAHALMKGITA